MEHGLSDLGHWAIPNWHNANQNASHGSKFNLSKPSLLMTVNNTYSKTLVLFGPSSCSMVPSVSLHMQLIESICAFHVCFNYWKFRTILLTWTLTHILPTVKDHECLLRRCSTGSLSNPVSLPTLIQLLKPLRDPSHAHSDTCPRAGNHGRMRWAATFVDTIWGQAPHNFDVIHMIDNNQGRTSSISSIRMWQQAWNILWTNLEKSY